MSDRSSGEVSLQTTWRSLAHRAAVAGGCLAALISLFHHVPVSTASLRGATAYAVVLLVARLGLFALERALEFDAQAESQDEEPQP
jgi:hypothetical protein